MLPVDIRIQPVTALSPEDKQIIHEVDHIAFSSETGDPDPYTWAIGEWQVTGRVHGKIVSIVGILERIARAGEQTLRLGGVGGVATLPEYRRRGLAGALLRASADFMRDPLGVDFGFLLCSEAMVDYYSKLGWQLAPGPTIFDQPKGKVTWPEPVMVLPVQKQDWPPGTIDLCGLPG
jgi:GNAT superfamily N-acetyltransferase